MYLDSGAFHPQGALTLINMNTLELVQVKHERPLQVEPICQYS